MLLIKLYYEKKIGAFAGRLGRLRAFRGVCVCGIFLRGHDLKKKWKIYNRPFIGATRQEPLNKGAPCGRHAALWAAPERSESLYVIRSALMFSGLIEKSKINL
jgi:hypothetical protein